jgi:hypothetical protein
MFAEFPSTPRDIADEASAAARDVTQNLPFPPGVVSGGPPHRAPVTMPTVTMQRETVVSCAGLLGTLAAMPSTPPDLRAEAEKSAEALWEVVAAA